MATVNSDLIIRLKAIADTGTLKEVSSALRELNQNTTLAEKQTKEYSDAQLKLTSSLQGQKSAMKDASAETQRSADSMLNFGKNLTVVVAGIVASLDKIGDLAKSFVSMAETGAEFGLMKDHFLQMNGGIEESTKAFELLKKASDGTLNDKQLLEYDNRMKDLNFTTGQSTQILDIATTKHHELGISIEEGSNRLTRYIETGSKRGLYTLGLDIGGINKKITEQTGLTAAQVKQKTVE